MTTEEDHRQDHVLELVELINAALSGEEIAEIHTSLAIAVACQIITLAPHDVKERLDLGRQFSKQLADFIMREDIVDWIRSQTTLLSEVSLRDH